MSDAVQLETFAAGTETAVDVAGIECQLQQLWRLAAESERDPSRRAITRACLFSLVVYCETEADRDQATATIGTLTSRHPCRAIVLLVQPELPQDELSASISAHCHLAGGGDKQVCCEQISIRAGGHGVGQLTGALLPLLESDVPTVIWWQGNFLECPELFGRLMANADRLLFDSSTWPPGPWQLTGLAMALADHGPRWFADLSWTRLNQWRALTAACFDDPVQRAELARLESVAIIHGRGPGAALRAGLFGGWLAAQLGWTPREAMARIQRQVCDDDEPQAASAGLLAVDLKSPSATFSLRKNHGAHTATVVVSTAVACGLPRTCALQPLDDASLISQELDHLSPHTVYERALQIAAALGAAG